MTSPHGCCAPSVAPRALHCYSFLNGDSQGNFFLSSLAFWAYRVTFWFSDHTVILSDCPSLPFWVPFSFGVYAFPPAASTYSFHVPSFIIMWCWGYDDPEGHSVQLELILQLSWALRKEDRGLRQAVLLSSGAGRLPGTLIGSQGSYGTYEHVSFICDWALSPNQVC